MHAPEFWGPGNRLHPAALALAPLAALYDAAAAVRRGLIAPAHAAVPVICVGNLVAGGAGKTPTALALGRLARELGATPHFLTRGYGGAERGPLRVEPARHDAGAVGDEALLLAAEAPTWLSPDRVKGAAAAVAGGAGLIVMDDGLQNPSLEKDLSLAVIDGGFGFGNGRVLPAGPLREPVERGLRRAQAVVLIGPDALGLGAALDGKGPPILFAELVPGPEAIRLRERPVVAFAGIGRPAKFFDTLRTIGVELIERHAFPDHHRYDEDEIMRLSEAAGRHGGKPVTTAKDYVRLTPEARLMVEVLTVSLEWREPEAVRALVVPLVERSRRLAERHG